MDVTKTGHNAKDEKKVAKGLYAVIAILVVLAIAAFMMMGRKADIKPPLNGDHEATTGSTEAPGTVPTNNPEVPAVPAGSEAPAANPSH